jgi:hypothetical protein
LIRIGRFPNKAKQIASFTFVDAPHFMELRPEDTVPMRTWFYREGNMIVEDSLETSLSHIEEVWKRDGPFDGILGFSMGGSLAAMLTTNPSRFPGVRFVLIGGAPDVPSHLIDPTNGQSRIPTNIESLHLIGLADNAVPPYVSHTLATRFTNPVVIEHEQGHCIPTRAAQLDRYVDFIRQFALQTVPPHRGDQEITSPSSVHLSVSDHSDEPITVKSPPNDSDSSSQYLIGSLDICQLQTEEVEVLSSIYSPTEFILLNGLPQATSDPTIRCKAMLNPSQATAGVTFPANWVGNLGIQFTLQSWYPLRPNQVPLIEIVTGNLSLLEFSTAHRRSLLQIVKQAANDSCQTEGETCLMQCIQAANDWLSDGGEILQPLLLSSSMELCSEVELALENNLKSSEVDHTLPSSVFSEVDEAIEDEWIKQATVEAGEAAAMAKTHRGVNDELIRELESEDNIIASASARGIWNYTVGLVGKPSAGKVRNFFSSVSRSPH